MSKNDDRIIHGVQFDRLYCMVKEFLSHMGSLTPQDIKMTVGEARAIAKLLGKQLGVEVCILCFSKKYTYTPFCEDCELAIQYVEDGWTKCGDSKSATSDATKWTSDDIAKW